MFQEASSYLRGGKKTFRGKAHPSIGRAIKQSLGPLDKKVMAELRKSKTELPPMSENEAVNSQRPTLYFISKPVVHSWLCVASGEKSPRQSRALER